MAALASTPLLGLGSRAALRRRSTASNATSRRSTLRRSSSGPTAVRPSAAARNDDGDGGGGAKEVISGSKAARFAVVSLVASAAIAMPVAGASQYHSKNDESFACFCISLGNGGRNRGKPMSASPPSTPRVDACVAVANPCGHRPSSEFLACRFFCCVSSIPVYTGKRNHTSIRASASSKADCAFPRLSRRACRGDVLLVAADANTFRAWTPHAGACHGWLLWRGKAALLPLLVPSLLLL